MKTIERWGTIEFAYEADVSAMHNPFVEGKFSATLIGPDGTKEVPGFYDGDGMFRVRFMPEALGRHQFVTRSNVPALGAIEDEFVAIEPTGDNHGPVVIDGMHFRYADGERCFVMGTTAYAWHYRPEKTCKETLDSLSKFGFNKIRMLFFPKQYEGNFGKINVSYEPPCYPFEGEVRQFDFARPNPKYFRAFERRLADMQARNIIADVILFHPYDKGHWNLDAGMDEDDALFYVRYMVARLASFRNVWWSLANEYNIAFDQNRMQIVDDRRDWDVIGELIKARDPYHRPISCHNIPFGDVYPDRPWMSHVSYQHPDTYSLMRELQAQYKKPVINDEYQYEGNVPDDWGNSDGELTLERHWRSVMAGGYASHGEAFIRDGNNRDIFWSYGGEMTGESAPRLRFLREIVDMCPFEQMERDPINTDGQYYYTLKKGKDFFLVFMRRSLKNKAITVGDWGTSDRYDARFRATVYDVWNCKKVREEILPPSTRLPITEWTAVILEKVTHDKE